MVNTICQHLGVESIQKQKQKQIEFDRLHRDLGPWPSDPARPRDVIGRFHHYAHKEMISRKAWEAKLIRFEEMTIKILPDLSWATLQRRAQLRPLLEKI